MTKKDYKLIASVMQEVLEDPCLYESVWAVTVEKLAAALQKDNPRFNKEKFVAACYGEK